MNIIRSIKKYKKTDKSHINKYNMNVFTSKSTEFQSVARWCAC